MDQKSWKQRLKDGEKIHDIVFSQPIMDIKTWQEKSKAEGLSDYEEQLCIRCADRCNRISFETVEAEQWESAL